MDSGQAHKKLRLSSGSSKNYFNNPYHSSASSNKYSTNDDDELWGDDLAVDDDLIQKIETQGYSQYQNNEVPGTILPVYHENLRTTVSTNEPSRINDSQTNLQQELQMKSGEVKNLRLELENKAKEFEAELCNKDNIIEELKRKLSGKQSEIEFQKMEKMSQNCKTPKSTTSKQFHSGKLILMQPQNLNNSFHGRFTFSPSKNTVNDRKILSFSRPLHKGDVLFKLLKSALSYKEKNIEDLLGNSNFISNNENEFSIYLETHLLELCRYYSFDQLDARNLLKLIFVKSKKILLKFHEKLSRKEINKEITNRKSKIITLPKKEDTSAYLKEQNLLMHTKINDTEKGISVRQTITMLAKLLEIEPNVSNLLIEPDCLPAPNCSSSSSEKISNMSNLFNSSLRLSSPKSMKPNSLRKDEKMDIEDNLKNHVSRQNMFVFDVVELTHDIVQEITVRQNSSKYEGVFSSILHLFTHLCNCEVNLYEKQLQLMINCIKKILFSLPGFVVVQYIIEFLSSSAQYSLFNALCCRSAAETFSENFRYFSFTKDTCLLQVICAYSEMMKKTPNFIYNFASWVSSLTSTTHTIKWLSNKTDSKYCECLLMLEQITIRIMLSCVDQYYNSRNISEKQQTNMLLRQCVCIFQQFRWQDTDFDLHISTCRGEYRTLLTYIRDIIVDENDVTLKFISQELELTNVSQKYDISPNSKNEIIDSLLKVFSEDNL